MNILRNIFRPSRPQPEPPPQIVDTSTAYVMDQLNLTAHMHNRYSLPFGGISLSLPTLAAETTRRANEEILKSAIRGKWKSNPELEDILLRRPALYAVPTNQLLKPRDLERVYATQTRPEYRITAWGPIGGDLTAEIQAHRKRAEFRAANRDTTDPFKALIGTTNPQHHTLTGLEYPNLYVVFTPWRFNPRFGIYTTYAQALAAAPENASIVEVHSDGRTSSYDAKQVRGHFGNYWGYASGYAPTHPKS